MAMPERLYARRYRNKRDGETEWHPYPVWPNGTPSMYLEPPGVLHCGERFEVQVVEYVLVGPDVERTRDVDLIDDE